MIIDVHGHYTTAPKALEDWRNRRIAGINDPSARPKVSELRISDDELRESIVDDQLKKMQERGSDSHHLQPARQLHGAPYRRLRGLVGLGRDLQRALRTRQQTVSRSLHRRGDAAAVTRRRSRTCIPELKKCVKDYGFVGINLNPDPSGGHWTSPPLSDRHWYPIYRNGRDSTCRP